MLAGMSSIIEKISFKICHFGKNDLTLQSQKQQT